MGTGLSSYSVTAHPQKAVPAPLSGAGRAGIIQCGNGIGVQWVAFFAHKGNALFQCMAQRQVQVLHFLGTQRLHTGVIPFGTGHIRHVNNLVQQAHVLFAGCMALNGR